MLEIVRSRTKKALGEILDGKYKVTGIKVIMPPTKGTIWDPPRLGVYDYTVEPLPHTQAARHAEAILNRQLIKSLDNIQKKACKEDVPLGDFVAGMELMTGLMEITKKEIKKLYKG